MRNKLQRKRNRKKDGEIVVAMRARKKARKKGLLDVPVAKKAPIPWPSVDTTPRRGECYDASGKFCILPNNGKKMFNFIWDEGHNKTGNKDDSK